MARCLKVSFKITSVASYFYILSGQKVNKNAKNSQFHEFFKNLKLVVKQRFQKVNFDRTKIGGKCDIFDDF